MTEPSLKSTSHKGGKNKQYSLQFKVEAVNFAEQNSNKKAAEKFQVDRKRIREWRSKKSLLGDQLKATGGTERKRIPGRGRKPLDEALEEDLLEWVHSRRSKGLRVSRKLIMRKAQMMHEEKCGQLGAVSEFNASRGWLEKFMSRNGLSLRRKTTQAQQDPTKLIDKLIAYILQIRRLRRKHEYSDSDIVAMDETPVWQDMLSDTTVDTTGERTIRMKTTGHEKVRISVCLAAKADGIKLKPMIVFGGAKREVKKLSEEFKGRCVVASSTNAWMNDELTKCWVQGVLGKMAFTRRLLAWDAFRCHITDSTREELRLSKVDPVVIPGGCTKYIQAPDVSWNKPFKQYVTEKYDDWMAKGIHEFTAHGNLKGPSRKTLVEWIIESWQRLDSQMIIKSFKHCGLSVSTDGSEDHQIHCLKPSQPCAAGLTQLQTLHQVMNEEREDPFQDIALSDEEEANQAGVPVISEDDEDDDDLEIT